MDRIYELQFHFGLMDVGRYEGVEPSMSQKGSLMLRKKYGEKPAQKIAKNMSFLGT